MSQGRMMNIPTAVRRAPFTVPRLRLRRPKALARRKRRSSQSARATSGALRRQDGERLLRRLGESKEEVLERLVPPALRDFPAQVGEPGVQELSALVQDEDRRDEVLEQRQQVRAHDEGGARGGV